MRFGGSYGLAREDQFWVVFRMLSTEVAAVQCYEPTTEGGFSER